MSQGKSTYQSALQNSRGATDPLRETAARASWGNRETTNPLRGTATRWKRAWASDGWARPFLKRYRKALVLSITLGVVAMAFAVGLMFTSGYLIDDAAERPELGLFSLLIPLGLVQVFGIGKPFLSYLERLISHDWVLHITSGMRLALFRVVEREGMLWTASHRAGDALGLLAEDIDHVQNLYLRVVFPLVIAWVLWIGIVIFFGAFSPLFGLFMLLALGVLVLLVPLTSALRNAARKERAKSLTNEFYANVADDLAGIADWRFAGRRDDFLERIERTDEELGHLGASLAASSRHRAVFVQLAFGAFSLAVLAWAAFHFGTMAQAPAATGVPGRPADWIAAFVLGFFPLLEAFAPLPDATVEASTHLDSLERLNQARGNDDLSSPSNGWAKPSSGSSATLSSDGPTKPPSLLPDVHLDCISFGYDDAHQVLSDVSLSIPCGTKLAVLGPSGSGKTTLLSLIRGDIAPSSGTVTLGGHPTCQFGDAICDYVGIIQQSSYLFNQTLFENLSLGDERITREGALDALCKVGLGELLNTLPDGLDSMVDEAGFRFSGGERHRIALARVLLRNTPIVLLDEPTVSLDPATERALLDTVFDVFADRTVVLVTHHLLGIEHVDRIVFIENGRIALDGSPAELAQTSARFQALLAFDRGL